MTRLVRLSESWIKACTIRRSYTPKVLADQRGAAAPVVAAFAAILIGMLASAVDVSSAVSAHARLRQAADTAALAAVRQAVVLTTYSSDPA